jgi:hypothetical protein
MMKLFFKEGNVIRNHGNNGIYGRFSNTVEVFGFLATLHFLYCSGHITGRHTAPGVAPPSPKLFAMLTTSYIRQTLGEIAYYRRKDEHLT